MGKLTLMVMVEEIYKEFNDAEKINVYNDGVVKSYCAGSEEFTKVLDSWNELLSGTRQMPAFGVSLNDNTLQAMKSGLWVEFEFSEEKKCCEMPYEKLLINVQKSFCGFNIIRYTAVRGYDGRCFYIDLVNKNMADFYNLLCNLG